MQRLITINFKLIYILFTGVHGFENEKAVEKLECLFVQTLYDHITKNYPSKC